MLPWFFAYDQINYCSYLTVYLAEMLNLPRKHPAAKEALLSGEFVVQQTSGTFCQTAIDQTIEQTIKLGLALKVELCANGLLLLMRLHNFLIYVCSYKVTYVILHGFGSIVLLHIRS